MIQPVPAHSTAPPDHSKLVPIVSTKSIEKPFRGTDKMKYPCQKVTPTTMG
jgi:hypothetical protein